MAGDNTIKFFNNSSNAPDLDRIKVTAIGGSNCTPESNSAFCARQGRNCGSVSGNDNCGVARTVSSCGGCASPQTCGGAGEPNVCGGSGGGGCAAAYGQSACLTYNTGMVVSSGGRNWTCTTANCRNCATTSTCAPGGSSCPWGVVWSDTGFCAGSGSGGTSSACAAAYSKSSCLSYTGGTKVSRYGRNWTCANSNCMNCATTTACEPGSSGCPWGAVWTDSGSCN